MEATDHKKIEQYLKEEKSKYEKLKDEPRILILGSSDSGKSTLLKQLKILYGHGFTASEVADSKIKILKNIVNACKELTAEEPFLTVITCSHVEIQGD